MNLNLTPLRYYSKRNKLDYHSFQSTEIETLPQHIAKKSKIIVKYGYRIEILKGLNIEIIHANEGHFMIDEIDPTQNFYSDLRLVPCSSDKIEHLFPSGEKITKVRDHIFFNSQLYVIDGNRVLRLKQSGAYLRLRVNTKTFRNIINQIKKVKI